MLKPKIKRRHASIFHSSESLKLFSWFFFTAAKVSSFLALCRAAWRKNWNIGEFNCKVCQRCRREETTPVSDSTIKILWKIHQNTIPNQHPTICSPSVHHLFTICSPYFHHIFTIFSPYFHHMFTICSSFTWFFCWTTESTGAYRLCAASNAPLGWWSGASLPSSMGIAVFLNIAKRYMMYR